jgi:hypothetical protein
MQLLNCGQQHARRGAAQQKRYPAAAATNVPMANAGEVVAAL